MRLWTAYRQDRCYQCPCHTALCSGQHTIAPQSVCSMLILGADPCNHSIRFHYLPPGVEVLFLTYTSARAGASQQRGRPGSPSQTVASTSATQPNRSQRGDKLAAFSAPSPTGTPTPCAVHTMHKSSTSSPNACALATYKKRLFLGSCLRIATARCAALWHTSCTARWLVRGLRGLTTTRCAVWRVLRCMATAERCVIVWPRGRLLQWRRACTRSRLHALRSSSLPLLCRRLGPRGGYATYWNPLASLPA